MRPQLVGEQNEVKKASVTETIVGTVSELWRYPVQSMQGEKLQGVDITPMGVVGDRTYGLVDPDLDEVVSSAQGRRRWRDIVTLRARFTAEPGANVVPAVEILLPDGTRRRSVKTAIGVLQ